MEQAVFFSLNASKYIENIASIREDVTKKNAQTWDIVPSLGGGRGPAKFTVPTSILYVFTLLKVLNACNCREIIDSVLCI